MARGLRREGQYRRFNRLEGDSLIQTMEVSMKRFGLLACFNRLEGDSLIQTYLESAPSGGSVTSVSIALRAIL